MSTASSTRKETESLFALPSSKRWRAVFISGFIIRIALTLFGLYVDANYDHKYTDIDYEVFTDGAREVWSGHSPYDRATYRYTPLLALSMIPNIVLHISFGKFVFVLVDMLIALVLTKILGLRGIHADNAAKYIAVYLFHPLVVNVTTRGSADGIACLLVLFVIYNLMTKRFYASALTYGMAVHFKIYPIIYSLPLILFIDSHFEQSLGPSYHETGSLISEPSSTESHVSGHGKKLTRSPSIAKYPRRMSSEKSAEQEDIPNTPSASSAIHQITQFFTYRRVSFAVVSGGFFLLLKLVFYGLYGWTFLYEGYLHHVVRADNRHNFSVYFYDLYLRYDMPSRTGMGLLAFLPQFGSLTAIAITFHRDLPVCLLLQTMVFVVFNKVCTAQYLVWYLALLPLVMPAARMKASVWLMLLVGWAITHVHWLYWGAQLENDGISTFAEVWLAGILYFSANLVVILTIISSQDWLPVFVRGKLSQYTI